MTSTVSRYAGCLLGLALGDALGAPHEGGIFERVAWRLLGIGQRGMLRYTDDGEMALAGADALVAAGGFDVDALAQTYAERMSAKRGYGPGARALLNLVRSGVPWQEANTRIFPEGSFGNGAAMRAAPFGLFAARDPARLTEITRLAGSVTHAHPLGWQGGVLIARAVALALREPAHTWLIGLHTNDLAEPYLTRLQTAAMLLAEGEAVQPETIAFELGHSVLAHESAVTAVYLAARFAEAPFEDLVRFTVAVGGDVDTIAAMAGGIWGASRGAEALPEDLVLRLEDSARFTAAGEALYRLSQA